MTTVSGFYIQEQTNSKPGSSLTYKFYKRSSPNDLLDQHLPALVVLLLIGLNGEQVVLLKLLKPHFHQLSVYLKQICGVLSTKGCLYFCKLTFSYITRISQITLANPT